MLMDFCGFTFNGYHSSEMGFYRVSDGSRYTETVGANFQDKTVSIPGSDGTYFFNSYYNQKPFTINIAYDSVTEEQLRKIREVFNAKAVGALIYDEVPYKAYMVKLQSPVQLKYICFDDLKQPNRRIYKGEGTIQFVAYYPYAYSVHKYLNEYDEQNYPNKNEWANSTRMKQLPNEVADGILGQSTASSFAPASSVEIYNAGDVATDFKVYFSSDTFINGDDRGSRLSIALNDGESFLGLNFSKVRPSVLGDSSVSYILINSKTNLVEGCDSSYNPVGILYNDAIESGDFFKLPTTAESSSLVLSTNGPDIIRIEYDYLYY